MEKQPLNRIKVMLAERMLTKMRHERPCHRLDDVVTIKTDK